jgi:DHA2 family multidrug resistance protein-like MFS transporter
MSTVASSGVGRRQWLGLAVLALPCVVYAMDLTVLNLALPALSADLRPTGAQLLWIVDIYGFMVAGALITMGALSDRIGGRRLLMIGAVAFAVASSLAAYATSAPMLIAARAVLGVAGATLAPSTLSLIRVLFQDPRQRTVAIGIWVTSYSVGAVIGPLAGGAMLDLFWWGSVLLLGVPVMALLIVLGPHLLPADQRQERRSGRIDLTSAVMSLAAVLATVYGLKHVAMSGPDLRVGALLVAAAVVGWLFLRRQHRLADPLIDLRLFRRPAFTGAVSANLVAFFVVFGMSLFLAQYLQSVLDLSPLAAGLWSVPAALGFIAGSTVAPRLVAVWPAPTLIGAGLTLGALGYALVGLTEQTLAPVVAGSTVGAVGLAVVVTLVTDIAVSAADPDRAGSAAAMSETSSELGGAFGIAVLGSIGAAVYRTTINGRLPDGVADAARDTVGAALDTKKHLPAQTGDQLAAAARDAFGQALTVTALIGAATLLAAAIIVTVLLRHAHHPARAAKTKATHRRCDGDGPPRSVDVNQVSAAPRQHDVQRERFTAGAGRISHRRF